MLVLHFPGGSNCPAQWPFKSNAGHRLTKITVSIAQLMCHAIINLPSQSFLVVL